MQKNNNWRNNGFDFGRASAQVNCKMLCTSNVECWGIYRGMNLAVGLKTCHEAFLKNLHKCRNVGSWGRSGERGVWLERNQEFENSFCFALPWSALSNNWYAHYGRHWGVTSRFGVSPCYGRGRCVTVVTRFMMAYGRGRCVTTVTATKSVILDRFIFFFYSFDAFLHCFMFSSVLSWVMNTCKK